LSSDLVIDPTVSQRAAGAVRRAHERHALVEYGKAWEPGERLYDGRSRFLRGFAVVLGSGLWSGSVVTPTILVADGSMTAGSAFGQFVWVALILFVLLTLGYGPTSWKEGILVFCGITVWPLTLPVVLVLMQRQWPDRYAERYHRRYVAPATDFDEAATALWSRAVETGIMDQEP
jgi:hypothetical protein